MDRNTHEAHAIDIDPCPAPDLSTAWVDDVADPRNFRRPSIPEPHALRIAVFFRAGHHRSGVICAAMREGIQRCGLKPALIDEADWSPPRHLEQFDVAVFYGLEGNLPAIFEAFRRHHRAVYVDLGYWGRRDPDRWSGYHKIVVNARHPTAYFRRPQHPPDRLKHFDLKATWNSCFHSLQPVLVAGMGDKGARFEGYEPEVWERWAIDQIRKVTSRPIIYRPKPSWKQARPIEGTAYCGRDQDLCLNGISAIVTHHSNVAVESLTAGIQTFCWGGVAAPMALQDLRELRATYWPKLKQLDAWLNDIAYTQWSVEEMRRGLPWQQLVSDGLL